MNRQIRRIDETDNIGIGEVKPIIATFKALAGTIRIPEDEGDGWPTVQLVDQAGQPLPLTDPETDLPSLNPVQATGWEPGFKKRLNVFQNFDSTGLFPGVFYLLFNAHTVDNSGLPRDYEYVVMLMVG